MDNSVISKKRNVLSKDIDEPSEGSENEQNEENVLINKSFSDLGLSDQLVKACSLLGWKNPTKIQIETIPWALKKRDVIGLAQTGSGKTAAFALPILEELLQTSQGLIALILAPTRYFFQKVIN